MGGRAADSRPATISAGRPPPS